MSEKNDTGPNIYQRIIEIRHGVKAITKDVEVRTGGGSYKAVSHDAVTEMLRPLMATAGVFSLLAPGNQEILDSGQRTKGGAMIFTMRQHFTMTYHNIDHPGDQIEQEIEAWVNDFGDKAPGKIQSYATKTALMKMFMVSTGDADEQPTYDERSTYIAIIGEDERLTADLGAKATEFFGDRAYSVLESLALRRFLILDGDWKAIPAHRFRDALSSLQEKYDEEMVATATAEDKVRADEAAQGEALGTDNDEELP